MDLPHFTDIKYLATAKMDFPHFIKHTLFSNNKMDFPYFTDSRSVFDNDKIGVPSLYRQFSIYQ